MRLRLISLAAALLAGCASPQGEMLALSAQRLSLAPEIAWSKYSRELPLYDAKREAAVLRDRMALGREIGVPDETTRGFFNAQMEASRRLQWEYFHRWRDGLAVPNTPPRDLLTDLRPQIDAIDRRQLALMARGAQPPTLAQLSGMAVRFLPKN